jgi:hypothetical protein
MYNNDRSDNMNMVVDAGVGAGDRQTRRCPFEILDTRSRGGYSNDSVA